MYFWSSSSEFSDSDLLWASGSNPRPLDGESGVGLETLDLPNALIALRWAPVLCIDIHISCVWVTESKKKDSSACFLHKEGDPRAVGCAPCCANRKLKGSCGTDHKAMAKCLLLPELNAEENEALFEEGGVFEDDFTAAFLYFLSRLPEDDRRMPTAERVKVLMDTIHDEDCKAMVFEALPHGLQVEVGALMAQAEEEAGAAPPPPPPLQRVDDASVEEDAGEGTGAGAGTGGAGIGQPAGTTALDTRPGRGRAVARGLQHGRGGRGEGPRGGSSGSRSRSGSSRRKGSNPTQATPAT
jgi:hypothetical protein